MGIFTLILGILILILLIAISLLFVFCILSIIFGGGVFFADYLFRKAKITLPWQKGKEESGEKKPAGFIEEFKKSIEEGRRKRKEREERSRQKKEEKKLLKEKGKNEKERI